MTHSLTTTSQDRFNEEVLQAEVPVIVDFYADWCAPCKAIAPVFEELADEYRGQAEFIKVDVDQDPDLTQQFGIRGIPTFLLFKNGKPVESVIGRVERNVLSQLIDQHVSA